MIVEQTFFCALEPQLRSQYLKKMKELLAPQGKLAGLLFDKEFETGPPFGGNKEEYIKFFSTDFKILKMDKAQKSIGPRNGFELFFEMTSN